jgi:hypothetical protein
LTLQISWSIPSARVVATGTEQKASLISKRSGMLVDLEQPDGSVETLDLDGNDLRIEDAESMLSIARPWL